MLISGLKVWLGLKEPFNFTISAFLKKDILTKARKCILTIVTTYSFGIPCDIGCMEDRNSEEGFKTQKRARGPQRNDAIMVQGPFLQTPQEPRPGPLSLLWIRTLAPPHLGFAHPSAQGPVSYNPLGVQTKKGTCQLWVRDLKKGVVVEGGFTSLS